VSKNPSDPRGFRTAEAWYPLVKEIVSAAIGLGLLVAETTNENVRIEVLAASLLLLGYPVMSVLDKTFGGSK
jgi:hypothetical protein